MPAPCGANLPLSLPPATIRAWGSVQTTIRLVNIEDFYAADERRRSSAEVELGRDWYDAKGVRFELSWVEDTGELYLMAEPVVGVLEDPFGDYYPDTEDVDGLLVFVLGTVSTHQRIEEILAGWPEAMAEPESIEWMLGRLRDAGVIA